MLYQMGLSNSKGVNPDGTGQEYVYRPLQDRSYSGGTSDVVQQQNGVPQWIQDSLGINAANMTPEQLQALNDQYGVKREIDGRYSYRTLSDQEGNTLGQKTFYDAPFSLTNDLLLPALAVYGGGFLGANALFGGAGGAGAAAAGNGAFLGEGAASGIGAWDAAAANALGGGGIAGTGIPAFAQQPGYGQQFGGALADASGASPYTAAAGGDGAFLGAYGDAAAAGGAADPIGAYLTTGATEGSTIGSGLTGAGGAAGAVGAGTAAGTLGTLGNVASGAQKFLGGSSGLLNLGGNLLNSYLGYNASQNAAEAQQRSAAEANALAKYMYDTTRADNMPALQARNAGLTGYQNLLQNPSQITQDPGYQFGFQQGQAGYDNSGSARGMRLSGAQAKALTRFGNDYGQTKYDQALQRYGNQAQLGATGTQTIANSGQNYANTAGQNITGAGNAAASGYIGGANAITGGISNFLKGWNENNLLKQFGFGG